jgi:hypothetical protein
MARPKLQLQLAKPRVPVRLAVRCVLYQMGDALDGAARPDNRPVNLGVARQAHANIAFRFIDEIRQQNSAALVSGQA